jgi:Flp pilus assembly protein TadG
MTHVHARQPRRRGATLVETAVIIGVFLLFLFGILEYCRYLMVCQVYNAAAREGARFAVVHTYDKTTADVQNVVDGYLAGQGYQLQDYDKTTSIQVFKVDPTTGNALDAGNSVVTDWAQAPFTNAAYGQSIAVKISGTYKPILPVLLLLPNSIQVRAECVMRSEAN